ncbi:MAG: hypothetical protein HZA54_17285, partial [Planctomycetes bacterium]|nr:hypothetical protein [Planctomycetota bacterium]
RHDTPRPAGHAGPLPAAAPASPAGGARKPTRSTAVIRREPTRAHAAGAPLSFYGKLAAIAGCLVLSGVVGTVWFFRQQAENPAPLPAPAPARPNPAAPGHPPAADPEEFAARDLLRELQTSVVATPDDPAQLLELNGRFAAFRKRFRGSRWESLAVGEEANFLRRLEAFAAAHAQAQEGEAAALVAAGRLSAAAALYRTFPEVCKGMEAVRRSLERAAALEAQVATRYTEDMRSVQDLRQSGALDQAEEILRRVVRYGTATMAQRAEQELVATVRERELRGAAGGAPVPGAPENPPPGAGAAAAAAADPGADLDAGTAPEPKPLDATLNAALRWLARHQAPDGSWEPVGFSARCVGGGRACESKGYPDYQLGLTGLSLLAYYGAGYTHLASDRYLDPVTGKELSFGAAVKGGLRRLLQSQLADGGFRDNAGGKRTYNHALATLALVEGFRLTRTPALRAPAQGAIAYLIAAKTPGRAWRYQVQEAQSDSSVTGWCVRALRAAEEAGLEVGRGAIAEARGFIEEITDKSTGKCGYVQLADAGVKVVVNGANENYVNHPSLAAVGMVCRMLVDRNPGDPVLELGAKLLLADLPTAEPAPLAKDYYYWHYGTLALREREHLTRRAPGAWDAALLAALTRHQHGAGDGCLGGSWDADDRWGFEGGRVYAVAINALTLAVRAGPGSTASAAGPAGAAAPRPLPAGAALEACPTCRGRRTVDEDCAACAGKGKTSCTRCEGAGMVVCIACSGRVNRGPNLVCAICRAAGRTKCPACGGQKTLTCPACDGERKLRRPCATCFGLGRVRGAQPAAVTADCASCKGVGYVGCSACLGVGTEGRNCDQCVRGNRLCTSCRGDWLPPCTACGGAGRSGTSAKTCVGCNGSGRASRGCSACASGWARCSACSGKPVPLPCRICNGQKRAPCPSCWK